MCKAGIVIDSTLMTEGVRIRKVGCDLEIISVSAKPLGEVEGTDIAAFAEALQSARIPHSMVVPDQVIQITR